MFYIYFMYVCMYVHAYIFQEQPNNRTYSLGISNGVCVMVLHFLTLFLLKQQTIWIKKL